MRLGRRGFALLVALAAALAVGAVFAYGDTVSADGDTVTPNNNLSYTPAAGFTEHCSTRGSTVSGLATIKFNGGATSGRAPHYDPGATVTVTDTPDAAGAAAGITTTGGTGTVPDPWDTLGQTFTAPITTTVPLTVPNGTYTMTVTASGPAHDSHGDALTHVTTDTYTVSVACPNSAPALSWTASPSSANEGDTNTYSFAIDDSDSTSWTFAAGYPSCGTGGTLTGAPSIDQASKTGTFDCTFPNGPASPTVAVAVSDGTGTSAELDQPVTVANVAPSASFTSAPGSAVESETKTYSFTVDDPGASDTYAPAAGSPNCGDHGSLVAGSLTLSGTSGSQSGSFQCTFPFGSATTTVAIAFTDSDGATGAPATAPVTILDAPLTAGTVTIGDGVEGTAASHLSFSFTDASPGSVASDFAATIDWGDGTTSAGTITSASGGGFTVQGSNTYGDEGTYGVSITVRDSGGSSTSATGSAHVADAPLTGGALTISDGVEGVTASNLSFPFADASPGATAADFTATIDWGDGSSTTGTVAAQPGGGFSVQGSHTYALLGSYPVSLTVLDDGGSTASTTGSAHVADAPLTGGALTVGDGVEGVTASNLSFAFADANPNAVANQTSTIDWGDGTTSSGTVAAASGGGFTASGSHLYADEGTYHVTVTVTGDGGSTAAGHGDAHVADAALTAGTVTIGSGVEGSVSSPLSLSFTDANPNATAAEYTGTINWGDGKSSTGTIAAATGGGFTLSASHRYDEEGTYTATVTVLDQGGSSATVSGTAQVADAPLTASAPASLTTSTSFSGTTASFTDANVTATAGDFTATIDWGDGNSSVGTVAASGTGFTVTGSHSYGQTGSFTVKTTILDDGGVTASASTRTLAFAFPANGVYVIGDRSATGSVTFFGGDWAKQNSLSGGKAPSAFKGFVQTAPACRGDWTTRPGGDDGNTDGAGQGNLPAYMAVIVSSSVTKSKDTISGNSVRFAIVKVDPQNGDQVVGTGTVVGTVPGC
jgi:PKD repeat protein